MQPIIVTQEERKLIGKKLRMSIRNNRTYELWRSFMPGRMKIKNRLSNDLISMSVYDGPLQGNMDQEFDKWAAIEVDNFNEIPEGMETFVLNRGLYAVFDYKGLNTDNSIFIYIFTEWQPGSQYDLDARPHFEVLGEKYKNGDAESEEQIWIPIRLKQ